MAALGNLYNLESFDSFKTSPQFMSNTLNTSSMNFMDAAPGNVLLRNLEVIDPNLLERQYPDLALLASGITVSNIGGYGSIITSLRKGSEGGFDFATSRSDDKQRIDVFTEDSRIQNKERSAFSEWTHTQIMRAQLENRNLPQEYLEAHTKAYSRDIDRIGLVGFEPADQNGLLNNAGYGTPDTSAAIETLTPLQRYNVISDLIIAQWQGCQNIEAFKATAVIMPTRVLNVLQKTILDTAAGSDTVLQALNKNYPDVNFLSSFRAESVGGVSRTVAYSTTMQSAQMRIPVPLRVSPIIEYLPNRFRTDSNFLIAGWDVLEKTSGRILTGL